MFLTIEPFLQVLVSALLGALIGLERKSRKKEAGLRTFALVSMGSCFFTLTAIYYSANNSGTAFAPASVIQAVALGIGFIGSGLILHRKSQIEGLTTAAALWATGAMGIGIGLGFYGPTIFGVILTLLILSGLSIVERKLFGRDHNE